MEFKLGLVYNEREYYRRMPMTIEEARAWFGNLNQVCIALDIASQNMTSWKKHGYIPWKLQFRIAMLTEGELMPDDEDPYLVRNPKQPKLKRKTNELQK